jgi:hypothetical protein
MINIENSRFDEHPLSNLSLALGHAAVKGERLNLPLPSRERD